MFAAAAVFTQQTCEVKLIVRRRVMVWAHLRVVRNVCGVKPTVQGGQVRVRERCLQCSDWPVPTAAGPAFTAVACRSQGEGVRTWL